MITYDYYRIFYFVAQYHSFTKAAEILKNNQPNITRCMNNLESELGCKLFIRSHQGVTLTAEGEKVYERVAVAYEQLRTVEEELALERSLESGLITIGASETALRLMLLSRLEHFHTRYPHVRLRISNHSTPQAIQALENGLVDFAVVTSPVEIRKPLHKIPIFPFQEILIGGSKYASLSAEPHHLGELSEYPFISIASNLVISYINQDTSHLSGTLKEFAKKQEIDEPMLLSMLRSLDLDREQFVKNMEEFSEGQKKKVLIAASLLTPAHLYLWDEPLNYIDVFSRMQIEKLIAQFQPTMLIVEHDARFAKKLATKVVEL